jgi:hypothetical protein
MENEVVFAPDVPDRARRSIERFPEYWQRCSEPLKAPDRREVWRGTWKAVSGRLVHNVLGVGVIGGAVVSLFSGGIALSLRVGEVLSASAAWWLAGVPGLVATLVLSLVASQVSVDMGLVSSFPAGRHARRIRAWHGRYVPLEHLDHEGRELFERARKACEAVTETRVHQDGLLDGTANRLILADELWSLAERLEHESALASSLRELESREPTPELEAVLKRQRQMVKASRTATSTRVEALETYAHKARIADSVYLASLQASHDEEFLALAARTDDTTALASLDDTATALHRALQEAQDAHLAFENDPFRS